MTNFEKIKSMSEKALTHFLTKEGCDYCNSDLYHFCRNYVGSIKCETVAKKWLESECDADDK